MPRPVSARQRALRAYKGEEGLVVTTETEKSNRKIAAMVPAMLTFYKKKTCEFPCTSSSSIKDICKLIFWYRFSRI